jgi:hypothetical protein
LHSYPVQIRDGSLVGTGTVDGNLVLGYDPAAGQPPQTSPSIAPGIAGVNNGIGVLTITQSFQIFSTGANTYINLDGTGQIDRIVVQGSYAALNGKAHVVKDWNYQPSKGTTVAFMTYNAVSGDFASAIVYNNGWPPPPGAFISLYFKPEKRATEYVLLAKETFDP